MCGTFKMRAGEAHCLEQSLICQTMFVTDQIATMANFTLIVITFFDMFTANFDLGNTNSFALISA